MPIDPQPNNEESRDLGFGAVVARQNRRLLNRDGSFNVARRGLSFRSSLSLYHSLLTMSWSRFLGLVVGSYVVANALFACAYVLCGPEALTVPEGMHVENRFLLAFFFSIHTLATIGYGNITPVSLAANVIVSVESLLGLLGFALVTGILFARFSRPTARIIFSERAVIAPYHGGTALMFRIANARSNQLIEVSARVLFARFEPGRSTRRFHQLKLEREQVAFFPLSWTVVHPIDEESPLSGLTAADLRAGDAEFPILLTGIDETFSQTVHARSSYKWDEIVWHARFADIFNRPTAGDDDVLTIDVRRLHSIERLPE